MYLCALIVTVMSGTAVINHAQCAVLKLHHNDCGVYIVILIIACTGQRCAVSGNLGYFAACQITNHIEIMNGHIHEDAARNLDVVHGLMVWVTGSYLDNVRLAQSARSNGITNHLVIVIEAANKAYLQLDAGFLDCVQSFLNLVQLGINRLLTECMLAGLCSADNELCVGVGGRANKHCIDGRIGEDLFRIIVALFNAHICSPCAGCIVHKRICYSIQLCFRNGMRQIFTMQLADASCAQQTNAYLFHKKSLLLL